MQLCHVAPPDWLLGPYPATSAPPELTVGMKHFVCLVFVADPWWLFIVHLCIADQRPPLDPFQTARCLSFLQTTLLFNWAPPLGHQVVPLSHRASFHHDMATTVGSTRSIVGSSSTYSAPISSERLPLSLCPSAPCVNIWFAHGST